MPLQRGPMSFRMFDVTYRDEPAAWEPFIQALFSHTFTDYPIGNAASTHTGLVEHLDWTSHAVNIPRLLSRAGSVFPDHKSAYASFRVDTRKVPGRLLKQKVAEAVDEWKKSNNYTKKRVPKSIRNDITDNVRMDLIAQTPWVPQLIDIFVVQGDLDPLTRHQPLYLGILGGDSQADLLSGAVMRMVQEEGMSLQRHAFCPVDTDKIAVSDFALWLWFSSATGALPDTLDSCTLGRIEFITDQNVRIAVTESEDQMTLSQFARLRALGKTEKISRLRFSFVGGPDAIDTDEDHRPTFVVTLAFGADVTVEKLDIRLGVDAEDGDGHDGNDDLTAREFMTHERISRLLQLRDTLQSWVSAAAKDWADDFYTETFYPWFTSLGDSKEEGNESSSD